MLLHTQVLRKVYADEIKRDLVEDVKSETSGSYEKALVGTLLTRAEWDAKCLRSFMKVRSSPCGTHALV